MKQLALGIGVILFGLIIGGVGVATAGIGIGIPMVPLGIYLTYRGWRIYQHEEIEKYKAPEERVELTPLERTKKGKIGVGILLIILGLGTSALIIGVPIGIAGVWLLYKGFETQIQEILARVKNLDQ